MSLHNNRIKWSSDFLMFYSDSFSYFGSQAGSAAIICLLLSIEQGGIKCQLQFERYAVFVNFDSIDYI